MLFIFNSVGSINGFDQYGHFLRALLPLNNCVDYETVPEPGCDANFNRTGVATKAKKEQEKKERRDRRRGREVGQAAAEAVADALGIELGTGADDTREPGGSGDDAPDGPGGGDEAAAGRDHARAAGAGAAEHPVDAGGPAGDDDDPQPETQAEPQGKRAPRLGAMRDLLDYVVGPPASGGGKSGGGKP